MKTENFNSDYHQSSFVDCGVKISLTRRPSSFVKQQLDDDYTDEKAKSQPGSPIRMS